MAGSNDEIGNNAGRYGARISDADIMAASARLLSGGTVAVPTETVYGLAADSVNTGAVAEIYRAKGRPDFNPLIVHVPDIEAAQNLAQFNNLAEQLAAQFWPGPLTLVLPKSSYCPVAPAVTAGLDTIALRCPEHPVMQKLLDVSGLYLAAPSANRSGAISPTTADHVRISLGTSAPMILDGGPCAAGIESTIVAIRGAHYEILRAGPVTLQMLIDATGQESLQDGKGKIEAPGQLASHYAPLKPLRLNAQNTEEDEFHIGFADIFGHENLSPTGDLAEAASRVFALLHVADASQFNSIAVAPVPNDGIGAAINDRLTRAAVLS